jgi:hypothetical protein
MAKNFRKIPAQSARSLTGIEFSFDNNLPANNVQATCESQ